MYYCENCHLLSDGSTCGYCGKTRLRAPREDDYCFLTSLSAPWDAALTELLTEVQIVPVCLPRNQVPSAYTNEIFQKTELYVPYAAPVSLYTSPSPRDLSTSRMPSSA